MYVYERTRHHSIDILNARIDSSYYYVKRLLHPRDIFNFLFGLTKLHWIGSLFIFNFSVRSMEIIIRCWPQYRSQKSLKRSCEERLVSSTSSLHVRTKRFTLERGCDRGIRNIRACGKGGVYVFRYHGQTRGTWIDCSVTDGSIIDGR